MERAEIARVTWGFLRPAPLVSGTLTTRSSVTSV